MSPEMRQLTSIRRFKISNSDFVEVGKGNRDACPMLADDTLSMFKMEEHFT
jgi:hypothetical protein